MIVQTPRGSVTIRPTLYEDVAAYRTLRLEALHQHPTAFGAEYASEASRQLDYWQERVQSTPYHCTFVAAAEEQFIGMTGIWRGQNTKLQHSASIWGVYVNSEWRGMGIIDALIEACVDLAKAQQVRVVKLGVVATNTGAIRVYTRSGFSVYGIEPEVIYHNGVYYDELLMARRI